MSRVFRTNILKFLIKDSPRTPTSKHSKARVGVVDTSSLQHHYEFDLELPKCATSEIPLPLQTSQKNIKLVLDILHHFSYVIMNYPPDSKMSGRVRVFRSSFYLFHFSYLIRYRVCMVFVKNINQFVLIYDFFV